ncbi:tetratricopeptide repeat protein [Postechiella marina]|uniref:Tetratricopeptide repeat protein n=1 Tax=Postechiella marina TaxID=943941 RepID=A0ABP8C897_9FLAO
MKNLIYILAFLFSTVTLAQNDALFEKGNTLYNDGEYAQAIDAYKAILKTKKHSAEVYFNLANAHYKLNNIAPSIYYYEKALQLDPNDADIKNNLSFAKNMTIDAIDVLPETGFTKLGKKITHAFTFDGWAKLAVAFAFLFVVLFLAYYFSFSTVKKRLAFIVSNVSLLLMVISLVLAFHKYNLDKKDNPAIVFSQESKVKSEPNKRSEESFRLHEGTKVQVLDSIKEWNKIKLSDGKTGWISADDIKAL